MAFTRLVGNFKLAFDEPLSDCTLFVGPNQSGKTSRLLGAQFALVGTAASPVGVHGSAIADEFAPPGVDRVFAELSGPEGAARFDLVREGGKWRDPARWSVLSGALDAVSERDRGRLVPMVAAGDLLSLGSDLARRAFVQRFADPDSGFPEPVELAETAATDALERAVLAEKRALWDQARAAVAAELRTKRGPSGGETVDVADVLVSLQKYWASRKRDANAAVRAIEAARTERSAADQLAGSEVLAELEAKLATARAWESTAQVRARVAAVEQQLERYAAELKGAQAALDRLEQDQGHDGKLAELEAAVTKAEVSPAMSKLITERDAARPLIEDCEAALTEAVKELAAHQAKLEHGTVLLAAVTRARTAEVACCPLCARPGFDAAETSQFLTEAVEARRRALEDARERETAAKMALERARVRHDGLVKALVSEHEAQQAARENARRELDVYKAQRAQARQRATAQVAAAERVLEVTQTERLGLLNALATAKAPSHYEGPSAAELAQRVGAKRQVQVAVALYEQEEGQLRKHTTEAERAKEFERLAKDLLHRWTAELKGTAEACVSKYMLAGFRAVLDLETRAWMVLDESRSGRPRKKAAASGFELNVLVPALAAAYTEGAPVRVLILDDTDLAGVGVENAERFFGALQRAVREGWLTQVLAAGNRFEAVLDRLEAAGWRVRRLGAVDAPVPVPPAVETPYVLTGLEDYAPELPQEDPAPGTWQDRGGALPVPPPPVQPDIASLLRSLGLA